MQKQMENVEQEFDSICVLCVVRCSPSHNLRVQCYIESHTDNFTTTAWSPPMPTGTRTAKQNHATLLVSGYGNRSIAKTGSGQTQNTTDILNEKRPCWCYFRTEQQHVLPTGCACGVSLRRGKRLARIRQRLCVAIAFFLVSMSAKENVVEVGFWA